MFDLPQLLIQLLDLAVGKVKFLLGALNVSKHVRLRLISSFKQSLVQLDICLLVLYFILEGQNFSLQAFSLLLFLLEPVSEK